MMKMGMMTLLRDRLSGRTARPPLTPSGSARVSGWLGSVAGDGGHARQDSYDSRIANGYMGNPVAHRACRLIVDALTGAPLAGDGRLIALIQARSGGQTLLEQVALGLLLHGNAYVQLLCDATGVLTELYALRPERVRVVTGSDGWPVGYDYRLGAQSLRIDALDAGGLPQIVHLRLQNPLDDHYGVSPMQSAALSLATHNAATRWNEALLRNAARPSGALVYDAPEKGGTLTADQFERLKAELALAYQGMANAGRPMLLEGGLRWQSLSLTPAEMDFAALRDGSAREIAMAFGVPPMLLGLPGDATYANYREASRALWRMTVLPLLERVLSTIAEATDAWLPGATAAVDIDRITALAEERQALWDNVARADFLDAAQKRRLLGLEHLDAGIGSDIGNDTGNDSGNDSDNGKEPQ